MVSDGPRGKAPGGGLWRVGKAPEVDDFSTCTCVIFAASLPQILTIGCLKKPLCNMVMILVKKKNIGLFWYCPRKNNKAVVGLSWQREWAKRYAARDNVLYKVNGGPVPLNNFWINFERLWRSMCMQNWSSVWRKIAKMTNVWSGSEPLTLHFKKKYLLLLCYLDHHECVCKCLTIKTTRVNLQWAKASPRARSPEPPLNKQST